MSRISYVFPLVAIAFSAGGCTIELVDGPVRGHDWDDTNDSSDVSTSASGGGMGTGGSGMGSGSSTSSGSGMGNVSSSGSGAVMGCVAATGTGRTATECDSMPIAKVSCSGGDPIGYGACWRGYQVFAPGQAEELSSCLAQIPGAQACDPAPVQNCVDKMYADACTNPSVPGHCKEWTDVCGKAGQALDQKRCTLDLNPFSARAIDDFVDCMNQTTGTCQSAYDTCFDKALAL